MTRSRILCVLLVLVTLLVYLPVWNGKPVWDDHAHLTPPALRSFPGLLHIWTRPGTTQQYYPLVFSLFWLEYQLWGNAMLGYHLLNILLQAVSALLLWRILRQLEVPGAHWAAAIFALHPVCVESVAWISEIKNCLSGVFYLSAALVYLRFDRDKNWKFYFLALGLFLLGLMSKTVIATLPAALLVIFWWQRGRLSWKRDVLPLIPFFVVGIGAGLFTAWVEQKFVGAKGSNFDFTFLERMLIAGRVIWFYLGKLAWPVDLIFNYPRWQVSQTVAWQYVFPVAALLVSAGLWWLSRWNRGPLAAWLFFVGTLFPALGFFNVYPFRFSFVADHFQYLATLGPITLAAAGIARFFGALKGKPPWWESVFCGVLLAILGTLTWRQSGTYVNEETLWRTTIARNPNSFLAYNNLGFLMDQRGQGDKALAYFRKSVKLQPDYALAQNNLGNALSRTGHFQEAIGHYREALRLKPDKLSFHSNLGAALVQTGHFQEAIEQFRAALRLAPDDAQIHGNLGDALAKAGQLSEAIGQFQMVLQLQPDNAMAYNSLGDIFLRQGQIGEAVVQFQQVLELQPGNVGAASKLAWIFATCPNGSLRDGSQALELAQQANQLSGGRDPAILGTLAAAYAETGRFSEATATADKALHLAESQTNTVSAVKDLQAQIKDYEKNIPFRDRRLMNTNATTFH